MAMELPTLGGKVVVKFSWQGHGYPLPSSMDLYMRKSINGNNE
jgi:hypothetical protein